MIFNEANPFLDIESAIPRRENPSYGSELPHDFPYDPGQTRTIYELGYIPRGESLVVALVVAVIGIGAILWVIKNKINLHTLGVISSLVAIFLVFLGPMILPSFFPFQTTLGLAKVAAVTAVIMGATSWIQQKTFPLAAIRSFLPISLYVLSLLTSIVVMTNPTFFMEDFLIILTGIFFFVVGFMWLWEENTIDNLIRIIGLATLIPSLLVLFVYAMPAQGISLVTSLYPRYENIVFQFDYARGRILSVIDLEFFAPFVLYGLVSSKKKWSKWGVVYLIMFFAVLLTNYRYKVLTFFVGSVASLTTASKTLRRRILIVGGSIITLVFTLYMMLQTAVGNPTIVDRFLLRDYANDVDSLRRRVVMFEQAWNIFTEHPFIGVGLGNYKDNVQVVYESFGGRYYEPFFKVLQNVYAYPHNWFIQILAENGIVGFLAVIFLLVTFARIDRDILRRIKGKHKVAVQTIMTVSWLYVFANQFTPLSNSLPMVIFFWTFRGILERINLEKCGIRP